jgi:hypothetical protein
MKKAFVFSILLAQTTLGFTDQTVRVDFSKSHIHTTSSSGNVDVSMGPEVYYNSYYGSSWLMHRPGSSYITVSFDKGIHANGQAKLSITHLASVVGKTYYAPITIHVNNSTLVSGFSPNFYDYITDNFDMSGLLHDGTNTITLSFDGDAPCNYWIQSVNVNIAD